MTRTAVALVVAALAVVSLVASNGDDDVVGTPTTAAPDTIPPVDPGIEVDAFTERILPQIQAGDWTGLVAELGPIVAAPDTAEPAVHAAAVEVYTLAVARLAETDPDMRGELERLVNDPPVVTYDGPLPPLYAELGAEADEVARAVLGEDG